MTYVSLFAGAGGFDIGFDRSGFTCLAQVEIDRTCRDVLARHWPDVPRFPDVRAFGKKQVPHADVVVGGFPCQDVSLAGKRAGFEAGERSPLWFEMVRVIRELRPVFVVWENVPGLLSADEGRAFGWVLRELADLGFDGGWRTVDAQFFGVPQQRRRVFGVFARGRAGAEIAGQVLALAPGLRRHPEAGGEAGPGDAAAPGSGAAAAGGFACYGGNDTRGERGVAAALSAKGGTGRLDFETETFVVFNPQAAGNQTTIGTRGDGLTGTQGSSQVPAVVYCIQDGRGLNGNQNGAGVPHAGPAYTLDRTGAQTVCVTVPVTHTLTAEGHDASEDGTGRGTPIVTQPLYYSHDYNQDRVYGSDGITPALTAADSNRTRNQMVAGAEGYVVRRLMPVECERLMGWGDGWTEFRADGRRIADGPRYRMCGNGVVGTISEWLAKRLKAVAR